MKQLTCSTCGRHHETGNDALLCSAAVAETHPEGCQCLDCAIVRSFLPQTLRRPQ